MDQYCPGCLSAVPEKVFCLRCRKQLFEGARISPVLDYAAPAYEGEARAFEENIQNISLSGVQVKFSMRCEGSKLVLTEAGGTHILKPVPFGRFQRLNMAPANEHLTMQIAARIYKLRTAACALLEFKNGEPAYITRRFDVLANGEKNFQEDFAQLLGRSADNNGRNYKYMGSYEDMALLLRQHVAAYKPVVEEFFKLVLFNYIFSNGDAHVKNFSLMRLPETGDYSLSPAYDLMCTALHTPNEHALALEDGLFAKDYEHPAFARFGFYTAAEFHEFARRIGVVPHRAEKIIRDFTSTEADVLSLVDRSFLDESSREMYAAHFRTRLKCLLTT